MYAFLWWVLNDSRISATASRLIANPDNTSLLSAVGNWEISIKAGLGKLALPAQPEQFFQTQLNKNRFVELPVSISHTIVVSSLPQHHRDPFDRLLLAQARVEAVPIITSDRFVQQYAVQTIWWSAA